MSKEKQKQLTTYTTILHSKRRLLGISPEEYMVCDLIHRLANNPTNTKGGWCYASKDYISQCLGISQRTVFRSINQLEKKNLIERDISTRGFIKATIIWYKTVELEPLPLCQSSGSDTAKMAEPLCQNGSIDTAKMADDYKIDIKKDNNIVESSKNEDSTVETNLKAKPIGFDPRTGEFQNISDLLLEKWEETYLALDIHQELKRMEAWLLANPKNRKKNYQKFITNWLSRSQDRAGRVAEAPGPGGQTQGGERKVGYMTSEGWVKCETCSQGRQSNHFHGSKFISFGR